LGDVIFPLGSMRRDSPSLPTSRGCAEDMSATLPPPLPARALPDCRPLRTRLSLLPPQLPRSLAPPHPPAPPLIRHFLLVALRPQPPALPHPPLLSPCPIFRLVHCLSRRDSQAQRPPPLLGHICGVLTQKTKIARENIIYSSGVQRGKRWFFTCTIVYIVVEVCFINIGNHSSHSGLDDRED